MPTAPPHPCWEPGCNVLVSGAARCPRHARLKAAEAERARRKDMAAIEERRGSAAERGYDSKWQKARRVFLDANPLCAECGRRGRTVRATVVDHIIPHRGDQRLFWDRSNWQPLCRKCHDRKTARETARRQVERRQGDAVGGT